MASFSYFSSSFTPPAALPPPPPPRQIKYDVFLSFRGEDTRIKFVSHLHDALDRRGIITFIDYNLNRGDEISPALLTAIEESRISIIIFSDKYASSTWCLEELVKILECKDRETNKQIVIPVFYEVTPSDLRNQTGSFANAFAKHEERFEQNLEQVYRWKDALKKAADLSGWTLSSYKSEAEFIEDIVKDVLQKLDYMHLIDTSKLLGIDSKIKEIESLLCMGTNDFCSVGIWGIGGIGKTTLAKAVFAKIRHQFKGCSYFAENVREKCELSDGLYHLRRELLSALLGEKHANIDTFPIGHTTRLGNKKLLIVFDDVSDFGQILGLIGDFDCLGPQSRIIITSRDKQVLKNCKVPVNQVYELRELLDHEALKLFYLYAFRKNNPTKDYAKPSKKLVKNIGGIPLALIVLGSHLYDRGIEAYESAIEIMGKNGICDLVLYRVLKISYDGLYTEVQRMFLDIACFFKWSNIEQVKSVFNACGFPVNYGINVLVDKSLIAVDGDTITMHDLLEGMAKEIVRQESIYPDKRSRLWDCEEIYHILKTNTGTETIEGIALDMSKLSENIELKPSVFEKMYRLRILKFYDSSDEGMNRVNVCEGFNCNFDVLRYLSWHGWSIKSSLSSFSLENLVILNMSRSKVKELWKDTLPLPKLEQVELSNSNLISCPDLSGSPNLKKLDLDGCTNLREISRSIGFLKKLEFLTLRLCSNLKAIPDVGGLKSLRYLDLSYCPKLKILHKMPCSLKTLRLECFCTEKLPLSLRNLSGVQSLNLWNCKKLKRLPITICEMKSLETLNLNDCSKLDKLPNVIGSLNSLKILSAKRTGIRKLPLSMRNLKKLEGLEFSGLEVEWPNQRGSDSMADGKEFFYDDLHDKAIEYKDYKGRTWTVPISIGAIINVDLSEWEMAYCLPMLPLGGTTLKVSSSLALMHYKKQKIIKKNSFGSVCLDLDVPPLIDFEPDPLLSRSDFDPVSISEEKLDIALRTLQKVKKKVSVLLKYFGTEVPEWFHSRSTGYSISVLPNSLNPSFMGFALCVVVKPIQDAKASELFVGYNIDWTCKLKSKDGQSFSRQGCFFIDPEPHIDHVFVHCPILPFSPHKICDATEIFFEVRMPEYYEKVHVIAKCGVHLMFAQYIEEADGSSHVAGNENNSSSTEVHENCEEIDEPHPKRLRRNTIDQGKLIASIFGNYQTLL